MTETALVISNLVLWLVVLALLAAVFALARQIGLLHERVTPAGALMPLKGPKIGERVEPVTVKTLDNEPITVGGQADRPTLVYFMSPGCPVCKSLLPLVVDIASREDDLRLLLASDGETRQTHRRYAKENGVAHVPYVLSEELSLRLGVNKLPFAVLVDGEGVLKGRGLVNTREHVECLLHASDPGVSSVQD